LRGIKGIGKRLSEKYGEELVAVVSGYCRENSISPSLPGLEVGGDHAGGRKGKNDTKLLSLEMFEQGLAPAEIAKERELTVQTIEGHLAYCVEEGKLAVDRLIDPEKRRIIEEKLAKSRRNSLTETKEALGEGYSYGEIKLVVAHQKFLDKKK
jgi:hypothetical protein